MTAFKIGDKVVINGFERLGICEVTEPTSITINNNSEAELVTTVMPIDQVAFRAALTPSEFIELELDKCLRNIDITINPNELTLISQRH
jgi:hypothetical protein